MEKIKIDEIMDDIEFDSKQLTGSENNEESSGEERIRIYIPPRDTSHRIKFLRFLIMTVFFFLLFCAVAMLIKDRKADTLPKKEDYLPTVMVPETNVTEETAAEIVYTPIVIDESKEGVVININENYTLHNLINASTGVKVLIIHSHTSEYVSKSLNVTDAGSVIMQILTSAGIETCHCVEKHDAEGNIGSYFRMKESVTSLIEKYPDVVCIIDLHDSDSGLPITFTVGTDCAGWKENLRVAEAVCGGVKETKTAFRILPDTLGQDSGILTLNVGIGGKNMTDDEARGVIASFTDAFIKICNEKASAQ